MTRRLQIARLRRLHGLTEFRAALVAAHAFGEGR